MLAVHEHGTSGLGYKKALQAYEKAKEFFIKYAPASEDAIIMACIVYMGITGSVDTKAMEETIKQAVRINSYKDSDNAK